MAALYEDFAYTPREAYTANGVTSEIFTSPSGATANRPLQLPFAWML